MLTFNHLPFPVLCDHLGTPEHNIYQHSLFLPMVFFFNRVFRQMQASMSGEEREKKKETITYMSLCLVLA